MKARLAGFVAGRSSVSRHCDGLGRWEVLRRLAVVTSAMAGPMMQRLLRRGRSWSFSSALDGLVCVPELNAATPQEAISDLAGLAAHHAGIAQDATAFAVLDRESAMGTGVGYGIAIPHARIPDLKSAVVAVGLRH
jgi:hypothetical protein